MRLDAADLSIRYRSAAGEPFEALSIEGLTLEPGRMLAVTGPSGSGKTTLLHALAGLVDEAQGRVVFDGSDILRLSAAGRTAWRRLNLGFVFQAFHLIPELSPLENVLLPAGFTRLSPRPAERRKAEALMERFGVPAGRRSAELLSRGEQQRVALARALLFDPPLIFADEPTASLDDASALAVIDTLVELAREGRTVITVTHDAALIARADERLRLERGRMVEAPSAAPAEALPA